MSLGSRADGVEGCQGERVGAPLRSISNLYAIHLARFWKYPEAKTEGMWGCPRFVAFCSTHARGSAGCRPGGGSENIASGGGRRSRRQVLLGHISASFHVINSLLYLLGTGCQGALLDREGGACAWPGQQQPRAGRGNEAWQEFHLTLGLGLRCCSPWDDSTAAVRGLLPSESETAVQLTPCSVWPASF